jgi:addiction module HigA family antidote
MRAKKGHEARTQRRPTHPGALLREDALPALGVSVSEAARELGVTRQTLHRIMAETHPVTPEMAIRLGKFCGNGPELWLSMQVKVDVWEAAQRLKAELPKIPTRKTVAA